MSWPWGGGVQQRNHMGLGLVVYNSLDLVACLVHAVPFSCGSEVPAVAKTAWIPKKHMHYQRRQSAQLWT